VGGCRSGSTQGSSGVPIGSERLFVGNIKTSRCRTPSARWTAGSTWTPASTDPAGNRQQNIRTFRLRFAGVRTRRLQHHKYLSAYKNFPDHRVVRRSSAPRRGRTRAIFTRPPPRPPAALSGRSAHRTGTPARLTFNLKRAVIVALERTTILLLHGLNS